MRYVFLSLAICAVKVSLWSDLNGDLNKFFDSFGSSSNVSSADIYNGQKAGYATGGSVTVRNRVMNSKIVTVNPPRIDAGCGGIDIYAGGFSFINSQNLVQNLKSVGSASLGYAFLLGIETVSPQMANNIKQLQSWANTINGLGINSCETAAQLVGSVWPANEMASQHICRTMGSQSGDGQSYTERRHKCASRSAASDSKKDNKNNDLLYGDYNLAWKAIQQQSFLFNQKDLAELFMSITGTVIFREIDDEQQVVILPSRITDESILKAVLEGGTCMIYKCDDTKQCLTVKESTITQSTENSWIGKVQKALIGIQEKILDDEELSDAERNFLASSSLPLYKIVNVLTAHRHGGCVMDLVNLADIIAMDMLMHCLREGIEIIYLGCQQLKSKQLYSTEIDEYMANLERVKREVKYYETRAMHRMEKEMEIMKKIELMQEQIAQELFL